MELALYCPVYGYYEAEEDKIGRAGDYYTSVSVGPLFGELLAWQFAEWLGEGETQIVEAGAHRGELARDILNWLRLNRPGVFERLEYIVVEPSARRQEWQQRTLADFDGKVHWVCEIAELGQSSGKGVSGVMFSNELLDAMPVHRLGWDAREKRWFEWAVTMKDGQFAWTRALPDVEIHRMARERFEGSAELQDMLPDGFVVEVCPAAESWWDEAAHALHGGKLLTIDYGLSAEELLRPERKHGTLRAYFQHRLSDDLFASPGDQDLTAHVNFSALQSAGEAAGLITELFTTQARFLTNVAAKVWRERSSDEWTQERKRQFHTLTHPEHLGERFRVLVQGAA